MKKLLGFFAIVIPIIVVLVVVIASSIVGHTVDIPVESINITSESGVVSVNTSCKLDYEIYPKQAHNQQVLFSSSDENIATVDQDGNITFVGFGRVTISVTTVDGYKSKSCEFNVQNDKAYGINLVTNKAEITVNSVDNQAILSATIFPTSSINKEVVFTSSNTSIATVNKNGIVTATGEGIVTITATTVDGDISQSINITVLRQADSFRLKANNNLDSYITETEFVNLESSFVPEDTSQKYKHLTYSSSDENIATVNQNGKVEFKNSGKVVITAKSHQGLTDKITLYYTGGLPNDFSCDFPSQYNVIYNENDLSQNNGLIKVNFPSSSKNNVATFTSSNNNVVTIDNYGAYSIVGGGEATITIKVKTCTVVDDKLLIEDKIENIEFKVVRDATGILTDDYVTTTSDTYNIVASTVPEDSTNKVINYTSLNDVASVNNNGKATFNKPGKALIKLSVKTSSTTVEKIVTIISSFNYPTNCNIDVDTLIKNNSTTSIVVNYEPKTATITDDSWYVKDSAILTINNGIVTAKKSGTTIITYNYKRWDNNLLQLVDDNITKQITVYDNVETVTLTVDTIDKDNDNIYYTALNTAVLNYSVEPKSAKYTTKFSCNNSNIASVTDDGKIYFKNAGNANFTIEVTDLANSKITKSISVTYTANSPISAEIANNNINLWPGESIDITLKNIKPSNCINPNYTISESDNLLNINANKLTAVFVGTTTITINFNNGLKLRKNITVLQPVNEIKFGKTQSLTANKIVNLATSIIPINANNSKVDYSVNDQSIANIDENGKLTFSKAGSVVVTATANDKQGAKSSITIESTYGGVKNIIVDNKIVQGSILPVEILPSDFNGELDVNLISQSQMGSSSENVVILDKENKQIRANWPGTAKIKFTAGTYEQTNDIEVIKADGEILSFDVSDIVLTEGETIKLSVTNVTTSFNDPQIEALYIKYLNVKYTCSSSNLTIKSNILTANTYGIYLVTASINNIEKSFNVTVLLNSENIGFEKLLDSNILNDKYLSKDTNGNIISGNSTVDIGQCSVISNTGTTNSIVTFDYKTSDNSIATVNKNGIITFVKDGSVDILVKQNIALISDKNTNYSSADYINIVTVKYISKTISYVSTYNDSILNEESNITVEYAPNSTIDILHSNFVPKNPDYVARYEISNEIPNSPNTNVLSIIDNKINICGGGKATIKVTINGKSYEYTFVVNRMVESIDLGSEQFTYKGSIDITAKVLPTDATNKQVTFESSDNMIATVDANGRLTFTKAGVVTITATANDGSNVTSAVKVTSTNGGINDFDLSATDIVVNKGDSFSLISDYITISPKEATMPSNFTFAIKNSTTNNNIHKDVISIKNSVVTALCGGKALVEISVTNAFNKLIKRSINITVREKVESLSIDEITLPNKDNSQNYITSNNKYTLNATAYPLTSDNTKLVWEVSDNNIASVNNGVVTFKNKGLVTITVYCEANKEIYKQVSFRYMANDAYYAEVANLPNTTLNYGESFEFVAKNVIPSNLTTYTYQIKITKNIVNNGASGSVITVKDNKITASAGGKATIEIYVNNYLVNTLTILVTKPASSVTIKDNNIIFEDYDAKTLTYQINANILPNDTSEHLVYNVVSGNNISVTNTGLITLSGFTNAVIKVMSNETGVYCNFNISYKQKVLQSIRIKDFTLPKDALIGGEVYYVEIIAKYNEASEILNNSDVIFTNLTPTLYVIENNGKITAKNEYGLAKLQAKYRDKTTTYEWCIAPNITSLAFELNNANDNLGIKSERVFGTYSFRNANPTRFPVLPEEISTDLTKDYQMKFTADTNTYGAPLIWTSSNIAVADVSDTGLIIRKKAGNATITCKPRYQANSSNTASYTFKFVEGVDVINFNQYEAYLTYGTKFNPNITASAGGTNMPVFKASSDHLPIVLHTDIVYKKEHQSNFDPDPKTKGMFRAFRPISSLYGNGHTIDASNNTPSKYSSARTFQLFESDVLIDNVTIIGSKYKRADKPNLSDFNGKPVTISIRAVGYPQYSLNNVKITNSTLMNGQSIIDSYSSTFTLSGCVLKNSFLSTVTLNCFGSTQKPSTVTAKNCVFENALAGAIDLKVDKTDLPQSSANHVNIEGNFYLNNWRSQKEIPSSLVSGKFDISSLLKTLYKKLEKSNPEFFVDRKINIGITKIAATNGDIGNFANYGTTNINLPYMKLLKYQEKILIVGDASLELYATPNNNTVILPGMNEVLKPGVSITSSVYPFIRDLEV